MIYETTVRRAMLKGAINAPATQRSIINVVSHQADAGAGIRKVPDWNAHLSKRTYDVLKAQGVMA